LLRVVLMLEVLLMFTLFSTWPPPQLHAQAVAAPKKTPVAKPAKA